jgi:hypothetical protein
MWGWWNIIDMYIVDHWWSRKYSLKWRRNLVKGKLVISKCQWHRWQVLDRNHIIEKNRATMNVVVCWIMWNVSLLVQCNNCLIKRVYYRQLWMRHWIDHTLKRGCDNNRLVLLDVWKIIFNSCQTKLPSWEFNLVVSGVVLYRLWIRGLPIISTISCRDYLSEPGSIICLLPNRERCAFGITFMSSSDSSRLASRYSERSYSSYTICLALFSHLPTTVCNDVFA